MSDNIKPYPWEIEPKEDIPNPVRTIVFHSGDKHWYFFLCGDAMEIYRASTTMGRTPDFTLMLVDGEWTLRQRLTKDGPYSFLTSFRCRVLGHQWTPSVTHSQSRRITKRCLRCGLHSIFQVPDSCQVGFPGEDGYLPATWSEDEKAEGR